MSKPTPSGSSASSSSDQPSADAGAPNLSIKFEKVRRYATTDDFAAGAEMARDIIIESGSLARAECRVEASKDPSWRRRLGLGWLLVGGLILAWLGWTPFVSFMERLFR
jgi:hypothetical protein